MNVALVDKHPIFRTGVRSMLIGRIKNLTTVEISGIQVLTRKASREPLDIVIVGLSEEHPDLDRGSLIKAMKHHASAAFIVCASKPDREQARSLHKAGVMGIITKASGPEELLDCVMDVMEGKPYVCTQLRAGIS